MQKTVEAIFENGVLRPLQALSLPDQARVTVTIDQVSAEGWDPSAYFTPDEWQAAIHDEVSLDEVQRALSSIEGSLSDAIIAARQER